MKFLHFSCVPLDILDTLTLVFDKVRITTTAIILCFENKRTPAVISLPQVLMQMIKQNFQVYNLDPRSALSYISSTVQNVTGPIRISHSFRKFTQHHRTSRPPTSQLDFGDSLSLSLSLSLCENNKLFEFTLVSRKFNKTTL